MCLCAAPYMWTGGLASHPLVASYQYASSMLPWNVPAQHHAPLPTIEEIQQTFHTARQQSALFLEADFSHASVVAMREGMGQDKIQCDSPELSSSAGNQQHQQQDASWGKVHGADSESSPAPGSSEEPPAQSSMDTHMHDGSGDSWQQDEVSGLEAYLRRSWNRAMSAARAAHKPITFFGQGSGVQPQTDAGSADPMSRGAYRPYPVITTEPFSTAWREARQQVAGMAGKIVSSVRSAADSGYAHAPARALHSLQDAAEGSSTTLWHSWTSIPERIQLLKSDVKTSTSDYPSSVASSIKEKADTASPSTISTDQSNSNAEVRRFASCTATHSMQNCMEECACKQQGS